MKLNEKREEENLHLTADIISSIISMNFTTFDDKTDNTELIK